MPSVFRSGVPSCHCLPLDPGPGNHGYSPAHSHPLFFCSFYSMWECLSGFQVKLSMVKSFLKFMFSISTMCGRSLPKFELTVSSWLWVFVKSLLEPDLLSSGWEWSQNLRSQELSLMIGRHEKAQLYTGYTRQGWKNIFSWLWNKKNSILFCIEFQWNNKCGTA